jgi:hypothetical protein
MKIRSMASWGVIGAGTFIAVGLLVERLGSDGGFWGSLYNLLVIPVAYIWAVLLGYFFGTVEGPTSAFRIFFLIYQGILGFLVGVLSKRLCIGRRKHWEDRKIG